MIRTYGLNHLALAVNDPDRSFRFYRSVFGATEVYRDASSIQVLVPGGRDVIAFERSPSKAGRQGGVDHFGFRLVDPKGIEDTVREVERAGGTIVDRGHFTPDEPYVFFRDPDGYTVEVWWEPEAHGGPQP